MRDATLGVDQAPGSSLLLARLVGTGGMTGVSGATVPISIDQIENPSPPGSTGRDSIASESLGSGAWPAVCFDFFLFMSKTLINDFICIYYRMMVIPIR